MNKKILLIGLFALILIGGFTLYSSFAYDEEAAKLDDSDANYNLIYSLKEVSNREVSVSQKDTVYIDFNLSNSYDANVRYGMYYKLINPNKMPDNVSISLAEESEAPLESIIAANETKIVTLKIVNNSDYNIDLAMGALVGFENGNLEELIGDSEVILIK